MRELMRQWPPVLLRRWVLTVAAGVGFLLVGAAVWLALGDRIMLLLSGAVFLLSLGRAALLFRNFVLGNYVVLDGVCIQITQVPLKKCKKVRLLDAEENELSLLIGRQYKLRVGVRYRIYLQRPDGLALPGAWLPTSLTAGNLLGVEELEEERQ